MIRDITLGQYYPGKSVIHRLDARTKIIATLVYIVSLFIVNNFWGFLIAGVGLAVVIALSKVPVKFIFRGLTAIFIIIIFTVVINIFMTEGRIIWQWKFLHITVEGLSRAGFMAVRLVLLIIGSAFKDRASEPRDRAHDDYRSQVHPYADGRDRQDHQGTAGQGSRLRIGQYYPESQEPHPYPDTSFRQLFQDSARSGACHGGALLSRRQRPHPHERDTLPQR